MNRSTSLPHTVPPHEGAAGQMVVIDVNDDHKLDVVQAVSDENGTGSVVYRNRHGE